jgi:hypothetical protein
MLAMLGEAPRVSAFEALEGKLQVHGYFEAQLRTLARDFEVSDGLDLAQWYNVLNVEVDYDIAPDGWGPFDLVSMFVRAEGRYDCIWSRGCGTLRSADVYGDRANRLPHRLSDAHERGFIGNIQDGDSRRLLSQRRDQIEFGFKDTPVGDRHTPGPIWNVDGLMELFGFEGPDGHIETFDDPAPYVFDRFLDYRFAARKVKDATNEVGIQTLGPWLPTNKIDPKLQLTDRANPLRGEVDPFGNPRGSDTHPVVTYPNNYPSPLVPEFLDPLGIPLDGQLITPARGVLDPATNTIPIADVEKPFRMAPNCAFDQAGCPEGDPQGLSYPSPALRQALRDGRFDAFDQNFREQELAWNRGGSQQDEKELKELYVDLELFDSQLWLRVGKQNIVWGKTELFRTTDQFNPQDFALATLPDLEESRIGLWAIRGVYAFYEVGPLEDMRLELAMNYDQFEPVDIGRCGEPFAVNLVCLKTFALFAHGLTGIGLAGEERPPNPWNSWKGIEVGGRLEFRWSRFSFQISDFYGYRDFPIVERLFNYERNVDPSSGMPRRAGVRGTCSSADLNGDGLPDRTDPDCLQPGQDALLNHPANQTLFAVACGSTIGFNLLEPSTCGVNTLNSRQLTRINLNPDTDPSTPPVYAGFAPVTNAISLLLEGGVLGKVTLGNFLQLNTPTMVAAGYFDLNADGLVNIQDVPLVHLIPDVADDRADILGPDQGVDAVLSAQQEALLGCGPFFEVAYNATTGLQGCHFNGVDLMNAEASVLVQSWPGFEGTFGSGFNFLAQGAAGMPVPGTLGFLGGPVATRTVDGNVVQLPGSRGPGDVGYVPALDGTPPNGVPALFIDIAAHPFACTNPGSPTTLRDQATCQLWRSEMAALSWNFLITLVMLSGAGEDLAFPENQGRLDFFDPTAPFSTTRCSFVQMHLCSNVQSIWNVLGARRNTVRAGGQNGFGRRDFAWHQGSEIFIRYEKRNVLGFALDFAEDVTKSNWGVEMTWIEDVPFADNDEFDGLTHVNTYNMTISVDRPTFVNFLNANRTFFFNSQWFFQYVQNYKKGFTTNGPYNILGTLTILTGYFQDRLLPQLTLVYDVHSASGGLLSKLTYRFSDNFSATVGVNSFMGRFQEKVAPINDVVPTRNRVGSGDDSEFVENLISLVRERDELFLRLRYTF